MIDSVGRFEGILPGDRWWPQRESDFDASGYEPAHDTAGPNAGHLVLSAKNTLGDMFSRLLAVALLAVVAQERAATI